MTQEGEQFVGELRLGRQLSGLWPVTVAGLAALAGVSYLLAGRFQTSSPKLVFIVPLLGAGVVALTLLNLLELLAGSGEGGGSYGLAQEVLGGLGGFVTGWLILAGQVVVLAACLRAIGDLAAAALPADWRVAPWIGAGVLAIVALAQALQALPRRPSRERFIAGLMVLIVTRFLDHAGCARPDRRRRARRDLEFVPAGGAFCAAVPGRRSHSVCPWPDPKPWTPPGAGARSGPAGGHGRLNPGPGGFGVAGWGGGRTSCGLSGWD